MVRVIESTYCATYRPLERLVIRMVLIVSLTGAERDRNIVFNVVERCNARLTVAVPVVRVHITIDDSVFAEGDAGIDGYVVCPSTDSAFIALRPGLSKRRLSVILLHELGHVFGFEHINKPGHVMRYDAAVSARVSLKRLIDQLINCPCLVRRFVCP